jgi:hypothetical protein
LEYCEKKVIQSTSEIANNMIWAVESLNEEGWKNVVSHAKKIDADY